MAKNGKMVILRGNSDPKGEQEYPDELGSPLAGQSGRCTCELRRITREKEIMSR